ncbi:MAG: preprotein translocase subunit YajC [Maricaulaceae bacterium]
MRLTFSAAFAALLAPFAHAQGAPPAGPNIIMQLLPLVAIFAIFYFLIIRPQQKRLKQHRDMVAGLRRGDEVVTQGGMIGKIQRVADDEVQVELAEGVKVRVVRQTIAEVRSKTEPAND